MIFKTHKAKKVLKNKGGSSVIGLLASFMGAIIFIAVIITLLPIPIYKSNQDDAVSELARMIELEGNASTQNVDKRANDLWDTYKLNGNTQYTCSKEGKIQLGDNFTVTMTSYYNLKIAGMIDCNLKVTSKAKGTSEIFYK